MFYEEKFFKAMAEGLDEYDSNDEENTNKERKLKRKWKDGSGGYTCLISLIIFFMSFQILFVHNYLASRLLADLILIPFSISALVLLITIRWIDPGVIVPNNLIDPIIQSIEQNPPGEKQDEAAKQVGLKKDKNGQWTRQIRDLVDEGINNQSEDNSCEERYCSTCNIWRPPRSSHCNICGYCMDTFDHHCDVIGTCIAKNNHPLFVIFLTICSVCCGVFSYISFSVSSQVSHKKGMEVVGLVSFGLFAAWVSALLSCFGLTHIALFCCDKTTKETIKSRKKGIHFCSMNRGSGIRAFFNRIFCLFIVFEPRANVENKQRKVDNFNEEEISLV
eukprot:c14853_g1_i1.p1 GENE.c14853_g1_i1~~c14853_g1_i1.p1  ORF type:complete len:333 (+),score=139.31 c14853_g1_i1:9-1007(+)